MACGVRQLSSLRGMAFVSILVVCVGVYAEGFLAAVQISTK